MTTGERSDGRLELVRGLVVNTEPRLDEQELQSRLDQQPIVLVIGRETAHLLETQTTALTALNLLARLFRRLVIVAPDVGVHRRLPFLSGTLGPALTGFAARVHKDVQAEMTSSGPSGALVLHVADATLVDEPGHVFCAGAGWLARVSRRPIDIPVSGDGNPIGPLVAAALGAAEVFKLVFADVLQGIVPAEDVAFSALTLQVGEIDTGPCLATFTCRKRCWWVAGRSARPSYGGTHTFVARQAA